MSFSDLPKNGLILIRAKDDNVNINDVIFTSTRNEKNCIIHYEHFDVWIKQMYGIVVENSIFFQFSAYDFISVNELSEYDMKNVIFSDFEIFLAIFGIHETMKLLNQLKKFCRVFVLCPPEVEEYRKISQLSDVVYNISSGKGEELTSSTVIYDKKGRISVKEESITLVAGNKPIFRKIKEEEENAGESIEEMKSLFEMGIEIKDSEKAARDALELPFVTSRQEDGVEIRDAARRKIRAGGQIIYEPDQADDLDDSDPDDDLNI